MREAEVKWVFKSCGVDNVSSWVNARPVDVFPAAGRRSKSKSFVVEIAFSSDASGKKN
jgi:hypothetical protein